MPASPLTSAFSVAYQLQAVPNVVSETLPSPHPTNASSLVINTPCSSSIHIAKYSQTHRTTCRTYTHTSCPNSYWKGCLRHLFTWVQGRLAVQREGNHHTMSSDQPVRTRAGNQDLHASTANTKLPIATSVKSSKKETAPKNGGVGVMDILRIVGGLFLLNCLLSYFITNDSVLWGWRPWFVRPGVVKSYFVSVTQGIKCWKIIELTATYSKDLFP